MIYLFVHDDSLTSKRFTTRTKQLTKCYEPLQKLRERLGSCKKGTSRQRSGKGAIRKRFQLQKPRWEKKKLAIRYLYHETYRKPNEQLFGHSVTLT